MANKIKARLNQDLAKEVVHKFTHSLSWREPYKQKWDRYYKLYRSYLETTDYPWQSNLFVPYSFSTVETLIPRMVANRPQIDVVPREPNDEAYAQLQSKLIDWQWEVMGMDTLMPDIARTMALYGTAIMKVYWHKETRKVGRNVLVDEEMPEIGMVEEEQDEVVYDCPVVENVDLIDFFWDPRGVDVDSCRWVAHRTYRPISHLENLEKQGVYKNIKLVKETNLDLTDDGKGDRRSTVGLALPDDIAKIEGKDKLVELIEYWEDNQVVVVANRSVVIRDEDNPYKHGKKPFVRLVDHSVPQEFLGIGELEPIETLQYELNDKRNQRMDNVTLVLNRMWKVLNGAGIDEDELVSEPGAVVHTDKMDGIDTLDVPDVTSSSYNEETLIKSDIQQTTGVSDYTKGVGGQDLGNDTATGISLIQEAGNARFRLKIQNLEAAIRDIGRMIVSLNEQYIDEEKVVRVVGDDGEQWLTVKPEDLKGNLDVSVQAGSTLPNNEAVNRKQTMEAYQLLLGDPLIDQVELKKMAIKALLPNANTDKLLAPQQPQQPTLPGENPQDVSIPDGQLDQRGILQSIAQPQT